ncbi:uncharacterized protein LOC117601199 isoform X3 [Osmia lignaria lignaria]|uniref:uncharacterized protein LOC117601199 isoform X3 n=1 Tax=Osmia lignaria lignaria TaxID=1437193 RepID=UPI00402B1135
MYKGYFTTTLQLFYYSMFIHACMIHDDFGFVCDIDGCNAPTIRSYPFKPMNFCKDEDIPTNISFALVEERNDISKYPTKLQINFTPQKNCMYGLVLLANESVNKEQCMNYTFEKFNDAEIHTRTSILIDLIDDYQEHNTKNKYPNFTTTLTVNGMYEASGKFQSRKIIQNTNYCFNIIYSDIRSKGGTLWKPPVEKTYWHQQCRNITNYSQFEFQFGSIDSDTHSSLLLHIVTIILVAICGIVYIIYIIHTYKKRGSRYSTYIFHKSGVHDDKNEMQYENTGIVLLYSKGCESFMSLMTDFREMLRKVCGCVVHDWYDGIECNYVAEIGGSEWFAEMLHKQYCIIWIDTPRMRSLITSRFKRNDSEQYNFIEICDFRDVVFPTIFNLAKRNVEESVIEEARHFIVRLKGFDNFEDETDPFVGLFSRTRYFIPEDLNSLCSDLPILRSDKVTLSMNQEYEHLEQYLRKIKSDLNK